MCCDVVGNAPQVFVICGVKNSGKTTLLEGLVKTLTKRGFKVAAIKHDGHDFTCDLEGTDSDRLKKAGAYGVAVFSAQRIFIHKEEKDTEITKLIEQFPEADFLLIEGMKESSYPKIEVIRKAISRKPVSNPEGRILLATDWENGTFEEPMISINDVEKIAEILIQKRQEER